MEGEIKNFTAVWITVLTSLCYCHAITKFIPKGISRFIVILPIVCIFFLLPLNLTSIHLGGTTSFFIAWLANFKLLLFAFGKGPLSSIPPLPLSSFIPLACLPIKIHHLNKETRDCKKGYKSPLNYAIKIMLLPLFVHAYDYKERLPPNIRLLLYCLHIYFMLEMILAMFAGLTGAMVGVKLEPQFDEPYLSTSLQDFWGRRWNLMVSSILRPTVYEPVRLQSKRLVKERWAPLPAAVATFLVSGVMHELIFYYIGRMKPTGEVTCFFLINGACLAVEIGIKKVVSGKFWLPPYVSSPLALAFVVFTSFRFFFPPFLRCKPDVKGCTESIAFMEFVKSRRLVSPSDLSCPFL